MSGKLRARLREGKLAGKRKGRTALGRQADDGSGEAEAPEAAHPEHRVSTSPELTEAGQPVRRAEARHRPSNAEPGVEAAQILGSCCEMLMHLRQKFQLEDDWLSAMGQRSATAVAGVNMSLNSDFAAGLGKRQPPPAASATKDPALNFKDPTGKRPSSTLSSAISSTSPTRALRLAAHRRA